MIVSRRRTTPILMAALTSVLVAGCASDRRSAPPPRPVTILPSQAAALSPAAYVALIGNTSLFAVRASQLAATRSGDNRLRAAARSIESSQGGVASQLSFAGRRLDLLPSASLDPAFDADLARLRASASFDADYRRLLGRALARALEAHETFRRVGSSPTLRPVADMASPATRRDLDMLKR